jgi:hypothetical protein
MKRRDFTVVGMKRRAVTGSAEPTANDSSLAPAKPSFVNGIRHPVASHGRDADIGFDLSVSAAIRRKPFSLTSCRRRNGFPK